VNLQPLPSALLDFLEAYRIYQRRHKRPTGQTGGHLVRRQGDSLDFHEHVRYSPGNDIRHVDWRASSRQNWRATMQPSDGWMVRRFDAEEQLRMVISLDTCPTMTLPETTPKLQIACWLAEALAFIALRSDFQVVLHRLFGEPGLRSAPLRGRAALNQRYSALDAVASIVAEEGARINIEGLAPYLPPASVWVIITDLYTGHTGELRERIRAATSGRRWIILVELNSWPAEKQLLEQGPPLIRLHDLIGRRGAAEQKHLLVEKNLLDDVEQKIHAHKASLAELAHTSSLFTHETWDWEPGTGNRQAQQADFFRTRFEATSSFKTLFAGEAW